MASTLFLKTCQNISFLRKVLIFQLRLLITVHCEFSVGHPVMHYLVVVKCTMCLCTLCQSKPTKEVCPHSIWKFSVGPAIMFLNQRSKWFALFFPPFASKQNTYLFWFDCLFRISWLNPIIHTMYYFVSN